MKRRIISLLMALVMVLGLVPTTVWAAAAESAADSAVSEYVSPDGGADTGDANNTDGDGNAAVPEGGDAAAPEEDIPAPEDGDAAPEDGDTAAPENGVALLADAANVVSVTVNGVTTEYSNIIDAFDETVNYKNVNAAFKLLDDVELPNTEDGFPGEIGFRSSGTSTLDLNGHTITHADTGYTNYNTVNIIDVGGGTLTITGGGTIHGMYNTAAISVSGGTLTLDDGITVKGEFAYGEKEFNGKPNADKARAISITRGTLIVKDDTFAASSGVALEYTKGTVQLHGGRFSGMNIVTRDYVLGNYVTINEGVTIVDFLAPGYTYQNTDGTALTDYYVQTISDVKVVKGLTPVPYVDENGAAATATDYIQMEPDTTQWNGGVYVVRGNVTIDGNVTVSGKMPSIILCDRASLTVNGGITLPAGRPEALTIYGQTGGTGEMTVTNKSGAAFSCEGLAVLRLLNGTLTATGKDKAFSNVTTWNQQNGNDEIKCIAIGSDPEVWADGATVPSVTLSRCTEHQWSYAQHASAQQHMRTCALCGYNPNGAGVYENCVYNTFYGADESGHRKACVCNRTEPGAELTAHTPDYIPNPDGKTHGYRCTVCDFVSDAATDPHTYDDGVCSACKYRCPHDDIDKTVGSLTEGVCGVCGKRIYVARLVLNEGKYNEVVEYAETVAEALVRYRDGGLIVTLLCDVDMGTEALVVTYKVKGKALDLNGYTLSGSGDAVFQISQRYGFTVRNGKVENTGKGDAIQLIYGRDNDWGDMAASGNLTVEDVTATAANGWAIQVMDDADYADLNVKSGTFRGGLNAGTISGGHKIQIYGGTFIANPGTHSIYYPGSSLTETTLVGRLKDMLAGGFTYGDADGKAINYFAAENRTIIGKSQYNYPKGVYLNATTVTIVEHTSHPIDRDSGKCSICGAPCGHIETDSDGLCTACGVRIMFCEAEGKLYKTIQAAQEELKDRTDNPVIKLLADYGDNVSLLGTENGYTLDLNGFRLTDGQMILYEDRKLTIIDSSEKKTGSVGTLWADKGKATIRDGNYAELIASKADSIKITGEGTVKIRKISMTGYADGSNKKVVADLLEPGYAVYLVDENKSPATYTLVNGYYNKNNIGGLQQYLPGDYKDSPAVLPAGQYYTVAAHTHDFADSTQTTCACGLTCDHATVNADGKCAGCGKVFTAKVTDAKDNTSYYADGFYPGTENTRSGLDAAFAAAATGSTVTVLGGDSITAYLDGGKSLTLALNGKDVSNIYVGRSEGTNSLTVTGTGNIRSLYVHQDNEADLTGWTGKMELLYVYSGGKATLDGGTFDKVALNGNTAGSLLVPGYAFRYKDGGYVLYDTTDDLTKTVSVVRCDYEGWYGNENAVCPYCAQQGAVRVPVTVDGAAQYAFYLTLQKAVDDTNRSDSKTALITLLRSVSGDCTIDKDVFIDTKGFNIDGTLTVKNATASFSGSGSRITAVTMSGDNASFGLIGRGGVTPVMGTLTIQDGASWSSILPPDKPDRRGYKLQKDGSYEWRDSDTADADVSTMTNVSIQRLPIPDTDLTLWVGDKSTRSAPVGTTVRLEAECDTGASVTFYIQKEGSDTPVTLAGQDLGYGKYSAEYQFSEVGKYAVWFVGTKDGYSARSADVSLTITKLEIPADAITPPTPYTDLVYNGQEQALAMPGSVDAKYGIIVYSEPNVPSAVFSPDIPTAKNAGSYTFKYKVQPSDNYDDTLYPKSVTAIIAKREVTVEDVAVMEKVYDGTNTAKFGAVTFGNAPVSETPGHVASGVYSDCSAGDNKTIDVKVELRGGSQNNYMFAGGADNTTFHKTGLSILKAPAPIVTETASLTVTNDLAKTYTVQLPALPELTSPCEYGDLSYQVKKVDLPDGYYTNGASVSEDGKTLTLPLNAADSRTEGEIGTVTVSVVTTNYEDILLTVRVSAKNKLMPEGSPTLTPGAITYGQTVGTIKLSGDMTAAGRTVTGTFTWDAPDTVPAVGEGSCLANWTFTPDDQENYEIAHGEALITVEKAPLTVTAEDKRVVFGLDAPAFTARYDGFVSGEDETALGGALTFDCAYKAGSPVKAGGYAITPGGLTSGNYQITFAAGTLTVEKADAKIQLEPKARSGLVYNGAQQQLIDTGRAVGDAKLVYSLSQNGPYRQEVPCGQDAGTYTVWYKVDGGSNYKDTEPASLTAVIHNAELTPVSVKQKGTLTYNGREQRATVATEEHAAGGKQVVFTYSAEKDGTYTAAVPAFTAAGKYTVYFKANAAFHNEAAGQFEVTIGQLNISKAKITLDEKLTYNGEEQTQTIKSVTVDDLPVTYTVSGNKATKAGEYTLTVTGNGNFTGTATAKYTIADRDISKAEIKLGDKLTYNGKEQTQTIESVKVDGLDVSYTVSGNKQTDAGKYELTITGTDGFSGTVKVNYTIAAKNISKAEIKLGAELTYNGKQQTKEITSVTVDGLTVTYNVTGDKQTNAGDYKLTVTGNGNFTGSVMADYSIAAKNISKADIKLGKELTYNGRLQTQTIDSVMVDDLKVTYTVSGDKNTDAGKYQLTITGTGNFTGTAKMDYTIARKDIGKAKITLGDKLIYNGEEQTQTIDSVTVDGLDVTYTVTGDKNTKAGSYRLTVTGTGNFTGTATAEYTIADRDISKAEIKLGAALTYNGQEQTQTIESVTVDGLDVTYTVSGDKATKAGEYTLTVTGTGDFTGTATAKYTIAAKNISDAKIVLGDKLTYNGKEQMQNVASVTVDNLPVTYTVSGNKATNAGTYQLTVTGTDNFTGTATAKYTIAAKNIADAKIVLGEELIYNGQLQTKAITSVTVDGLPVTYDVAGDKQTNAGSYTLTVTGNGNFTGTATADYTIAVKDITGAQITLGDKLTYNGKEQTQSIASVTVDGLEVTYMVSGNKATDAGDYTLTITANGNFAGTLTADYTIARKDIQDAVVDVESPVYTGKVQAPKINGVTVDDMTLAEGTDYTALTRDAVSAGSYAMKLIGMGNFTGAADRTFTVLKAEALTVEPIRVKVTNGYAASYTVDLRAALNGVLPEGCSFGTVNYGSPSIISDPSGYCGNTAVSSNGILTLAAAQVSSDTEGLAATVEIPVETANYRQMTVTVELYAVNKLIPTGAPTPSKTTLNYGDALSSIRLRGSMRSGSLKVPGTFAWAEPDLRPAAGEYEATWVFTPNDSKYATVTGTITVTVKEPSQPTYRVGGIVKGFSVVDNEELAPISGAVVTICKGLTVLGGRKLTDENGLFDLDGVLPGVYNVVVEYQGKTVTTKVELTDHDVDLKVLLPEEDVNSELEIRNAGSLTRSAVVGGLDAEASLRFTKDGTLDGGSVLVSMEIREQPTDKNDEVQNAIRKAVKARNLEFVDLTLTLVKNGVETTLPESSTVLEIILSCDANRKLVVARQEADENGQMTVKELTESDTGAEGTYYIDKANKQLHLFVSRLSTYAIGYYGTTGSGGGSGSTDASGTTADGVKSANTGDVGLLPYAVMALSACTGVTVLRFRRKRED